MAKAPKPAAKAAAKPAAKKASKKPMTKSAFVTHIAEKTQLTKKQIDQVMDELIDLVKAQLSGKGAGKVVIPGLARVSLTAVKAVKGGVEKVNPLNGQKYVTKDKEAYNKVVIRPVKSLKEALK